MQTQLTDQEKCRRICSKCGKAKPIDRFSRSSQRKDGYELRCKDCERERNADYRHNGPKNPLHKMPRPESDFWGSLTKVGDCWEGKSFKSEKTGYARFQFRGEDWSGHRLAWFLKHGERPSKGMFVCHICDNRKCCNPRHLFLGTPTDNARDAKAKGRNPRGESHGSAKLTEKDIPVIRRLVAKGMTGTDVADRFGVSKATIYDILKGRRWKHVPFD